MVWRAGLFELLPFFQLSFDCDWGGIDPLIWPYGMPTDKLPGVFNVSFVSDASMSRNATDRPDPLDFKRTPMNFEDTLVDKSNKWSMHVLPLIPVKLNMLINILHGTLLLRANDFIDTCNVSLIRPTRARIGTNDMFLAIVDTKPETNLEMPLNLPKLELTQNSYLVGFGPKNQSIPLMNEKYSDLFLSVNDRISFGVDGVYAFPYLPFLSNCRGFGSYAPLYDMWENSKYCKLVPPEATKVVTESDFFDDPISDECQATVQCKYV